MFYEEHSLIRRRRGRSRETAERKPGLIRGMLRRCVCTARNVDTRDTSAPYACRTRRARVVATAGSSPQAPFSPRPYQRALPSRATRAHDPTRLAVGTTALSAPPSPPTTFSRAMDSSEVRRDGERGEQREEEGERRERALAHDGVGADRATAGGG